MEAKPEFTIPLERTGFLCEIAGNGRFSGAAEVSSSATGRPAITVKLVE